MSDEREEYRSISFKERKAFGESFPGYFLEGRP